MKKKFLLILLSVFMVFALAACGGEKDDDDGDSRKSRVENDKDDDKDKDKDNDKDKDKDNDKDKDDDKDKKVPVSSGSEVNDICGTWALEYDGSEQLSTELGTDVTFVFYIMMDFNSDNTMRMYVDADSLKESVSTSLMPFLVQMMYAQMEEMGLDKATADETFQQAYGKTVQEYCETELFSEENLEGLTGEFNITGRYRIDGDKLYLTDDAGEYDDDCLIFSVNGDTLTLDDPSGAEEIEGLELPLVLKKW